MNPSILTLMGLVMSTVPLEALTPIPVFLYGSTAVPAGALVEARQEAARILREAGVETRWFECSPSAAGAQPEPACGGALLSSHLVVRIVPRLQREYYRKPSGAAVPMEMLGKALCVQGTGGNYISIYYNAVDRLARESDARRARLLGYAIAHEIGHLLLGPQHSTGIMAADWADKDVLRVPADKFFFSASHRQRLETQVRARLRADEQVASNASR